jgi:hypothetical protein
MLMKYWLPLEYPWKHPWENLWNARQLVTTGTPLETPTGWGEAGICPWTMYGWRHC